MSICFAITSGEYDDFSIHAIYTTRELAEAELPKYYIAEGCDYPEIMELPLDTEIASPPPGMNGFCCIGPDHRDGRFCVFGYAAAGMPSAELIGVAKPWEGNTKEFIIHVWARDKDHAIKIAAEKIAHQRAIDAGIAI
jgi:hypothetical protein